jgi:hypothetical protein
MRTAIFLQRTESGNLLAVITTRRNETKIIAPCVYLPALQILRHK